MTCRAKKIMGTALIKVNQMNDSPDSSLAPSIPDVLKGLMDSDDSCQDPHFMVNERDLLKISSDEDSPPASKKSNKVNQNTLSFSTEVVPAVSDCANVSNSRNASAFDNIAQVEECNTVPPLTKKGTIRIRGLKGETRQSRNLRKEKRNSGKEYITKTGKKIHAKFATPLEICRNRCSDNIPMSAGESLFQDYWGMGNFNRRLDYIGSLITLNRPKRLRIRGDGQRRKLVTVEYSVHVEGTRIKVCKSCFLKLFGESRRFLETVIYKKRASSSGIIDHDARGSHTKNGNSEALRTSVKEFLGKLPAYESHYSRRDCSKKFLSPHLTITSIHQEYIKASGDSQIASYRLFNDEFHNLNLSIKKPKVDTCATCDKLTMEEKLAPDCDKIAISEKIREHQNQAERAYEAKRIDRKKSATDETKKTLTFDLQQCLPTPLLRNSISFYKRTLWTYNLTVYDCDDGQTYCYLWHEAMAARGANEVGSCLYEHITKNINPNIKELTMYSDSCPGQNKNSHIAAMCWVALQRSPTLQTIDHKFLIPGHTHMECDASHSLIERRKKKFNGPIEHPHDWAQLIRQTGKKKPFSVTEMERQNFYDYADLFKNKLQIRKIDCQKKPFSWRSVRWLRFQKDQPGILFFKTTHEELENFESINFKRRGKPGYYMPPEKYNGPQLISVEKKKDLLDLLPFISPVFHQFYQNLPTSQEITNVLPDSDDGSGSED